MLLGINAIYRATEGEGVFVGTPQVFVRFQGCAIGCLNCDSKDTWEFSDHYQMSLSDVLDAVKKESLEGVVRRVSITGGDPLHPMHVPGVIVLIKELRMRGHQVNIEAAGSRVVSEVFDLLDFISFDVKTPSTGVKTPVRNVEKLIEQYPGRFQIKAVIENEEDFHMVLSLYEQLGRPLVPWVLTPAYNLEEAFPEQRFLSVIDLNERHGGFFRVIGQQHKF
jgi:7-carboxy-7-deazaguanine synthase